MEIVDTIVFKRFLFWKFPDLSEEINAAVEWQEAINSYHPQKIVFMSQKISETFQQNYIQSDSVSTSTFGIKYAAR